MPIESCSGRCDRRHCPIRITQDVSGSGRWRFLFYAKNKPRSVSAGVKGSAGARGLQCSAQCKPVVPVAAGCAGSQSLGDRALAGRRGSATTSAELGPDFRGGQDGDREGDHGLAEHVADHGDGEPQCGEEQVFHGCG